jgi:hypothetical protein
MNKPHDTHPSLAEKRLWLGRLREHHLVLAKRFLAAGGGAIFPVDLFMGVANRSVYLLDGYLNAKMLWANTPTPSLKVRANRAISAPSAITPTEEPSPCTPVDPWP